MTRVLGSPDGRSREFEGKLRRAAASIREDADGRTCGGCLHWRDGWCGERINIEDSPLVVLGPGAVACASWDDVEQRLTKAADDAR